MPKASPACQKPKIKFLECVLMSKCYREKKSFEKCIKHWKTIWDEGEPDPPCFHERRTYYMCRQAEWDPRYRFRGNPYSDPKDQKESN